MTDEKQFGTKTFKNFTIFLNISKKDFFEDINYTPYQQAKRHTNSEEVEQNGKINRM